MAKLPTLTARATRLYYLTPLPSPKLLSAYFTYFVYPIILKIIRSVRGVEPLYIEERPMSLKHYLRTREMYNYPNEILDNFQY